MKVLRLTLRNDPWETMNAELKRNEYRRDAKWIRSRLIDSKTGLDKPITHVQFDNGYGKVRYFVCTFLGYSIAKKNYTVKYYADGNVVFEVKVKKGQYNIKLGVITKRGNITSIELF